MVVNAKGQIVIPKRIRERFGIYPGEPVEFAEEQGKLVLVKKGLGNRFLKLAKKYHFEFPKGIQTKEEFLNQARGK